MWLTGSWTNVQSILIHICNTIAKYLAPNRVRIHGMLMQNSRYLDKRQSFSTDRLIIDE